jgi:hypothetical protein
MPKKKNRKEGHMYTVTKRGKTHVESNSCWCEPAILDMGGSTIAVHTGSKKGELVSVVIDTVTGERLIV